ncbi:MAG: aminotransferase class III-fold pyridoxal phosphate-dependent enzyme, partial [Alphaproteobacteria bacterium]
QTFAPVTPLVPMFEADLSQAAVLDLTPDNIKLSANRTHPDETELDAFIKEANAAHGLTLGRYGEARLIYGGTAFGATDHAARRRRTIHIAVDVFLPAGTEVRAILPGSVIFAEYRPERHDYGGTLILEHHRGDGTSFRALYGHLSKASAENLQPGQTFEAGDVIAHLGAEAENGDWPPHLHLQVGSADASADPDQWPGVVDADDWDLWTHIFPNPASLLSLPDALVDARPEAVSTLRQRRSAMTAANLKLSYSDPIHAVRGQGTFLIDAEGRRFLDAYNNVPHVGHTHPHVAQRVAEQVQRLSTNTRYLSELHLDYIEHLLSYFPDEFDTCFLVNSGSEANEVAMRLATVFTGATDIAVSEASYHGITQKALDISHYKFAGPGGQGQAEWVHTLPIPNTFSGPYQGETALADMTVEAVGLINQIGNSDRRLAACLLEVFPSVGGQIVPPAGYLPALVEAVRAQGALFIADEVQTGLGRLGSPFWAFEQQQATPDIVVLGKPIGNGHPMGAVITRREIAEAFSNGMEFFSTFGGSTVSSVAGKAVLEVMEAEKLDQQAARSGAALLKGLTALFATCPLRSDVRGLGLFLGVELLLDDGGPATELVGQIVNGMRQRRILMGSDGPLDNVLKIRPPLSFTEADATFFLEQLDGTLRELGLR